jgi:hypothetical protein
MVSKEHESTKADADAPCRKKPSNVANRYGVSNRTAGEIIRAAVAAGVLTKLSGKKGGMTIGRWSALDTFVEGGLAAPQRRGRRAL